MTALWCVVAALCVAVLWLLHRAVSLGAKVDVMVSVLREIPAVNESAKRLAGTDLPEDP